VKDRAVLLESGTEVVVFFLAAVRHPDSQALLHLPVSISDRRPDSPAFELPLGSDRMFVREAEASEAYVRFVVDGFNHQGKFPTRAGDALRFHGEGLGEYRATGAGPASDSTNLLVRIATARADLVFKSYKMPDPRNREPEIAARLHRKQFRHVPPYLGEIAIGQGPTRLVVSLATKFEESSDLLTWMTDGWRGELAGGLTPAAADFEGASLEVAGSLGDATAALHEALFDRHPGPWQAESFRAEDATAARRGAITNLGESLRRLVILSKGPDPRKAGLAAQAREFLFDGRRDVEEILRGLDAALGTPKSVVHGDLHLGQVLRRADGALFFVDFEGEPERPPTQRPEKVPPLRDVATMNRSFSYVKHFAWREATHGDATAATGLLMREGLPESAQAIARRLLAWEAAATGGFTTAYLSRVPLYEGLPPEDVLRAIRGWMMERALYELRYELKLRPENVFIPLEGIMTLAMPPFP